ncbi:MAG: RNA-binding transcriptional accessory protein [Bacteroidetes bacterium GWF2_43_63]|nr:MAG: RNA-binding transcriptional accessory protein [Bacteroidetes bacterium GWE2_42_42]OFY56425.1 MAG: RNA-binding transcriptional accessory protein [Bacteroidetes bacterium GWF2_43_63]HBG72011.1 RNA-binding transcriptional accessory protein [Bacteroidales bacterium]HCB63034.1 RNA-binding transcriptional accessory protein [Bacteroidales bacterium]HCY23253.1 RNA-binding transcriptional accessory protein [Bacteroidales bacterium]
MKSFTDIICIELGLKPTQVANTIKLLEEGATVPFIARYRKEMTGTLDEVQIMAIKTRLHQLTELEKRKSAVLESINEQGKLTPELETKIKNASTMPEVEDLYLPYKPKRKTRATMAIAKGLEPLAKRIFNQHPFDLLEAARHFISEEKGVTSEEEAIAGARDIIAEWISEDARVRSDLRALFIREGVIYSKVVKGKEADGAKFENYFSISEPLAKAPSHRILAVFRGENEGFLRVSVEPETDKAVDLIDRRIVSANNAIAEEVQKAVDDSYKRLLQPSLETEVRKFYKEKADKEAIIVFADNLRQLLLASPLGQKTVLAIDPGFRTGCKVVVLDPQGNLMHNETIYPHPPENKVKEALNKIDHLVEAYKVEAIAIGNGTAGRETETFIKRIQFSRPVIALAVNESGASIYSASDVAREEFPDYDITVRGAVSIGRRLMDPLAELVKIDAKSIGVGQYQHDVDQNMLREKLDETVMSAVNNVGVELNTASKQLLTYVSGIGPAMAQNIVEHRKEKGVFKTRKDLLKVKRFGDKAFEQAAGFLRIKDASNPLDASAVHPESYGIVEKMAKDLNCTVADLIHNKELRAQIKPQNYITEKFGLPTINDILKELEKPGRDPREKFELFEFDQNVHNIDDLIPGMELPGIVTNITKFGAFVDIGVHQDGLVHISQIADRFIADPSEVLKLNQKVKVRVLEVDKARKRINLSMRGV